MSFPVTSVNLLTKLKSPEGGPQYQVSWKRFLELYHAPITLYARSSYLKHTNGHQPSSGFIEDAVANTVADFFSRSQYNYDRSKGKLRTYLRMLTNARVVDLLRKESPLNQKSIEDSITEIPSELPDESAPEHSAMLQSLLATLIEDLRSKIPLRRFEIFERVKLKNHTPQYVADEFGIPRAMVDREIYKAMTSLRELAAAEEYQNEFYEQ